MALLLGVEPETLKTLQKERQQLERTLSKELEIEQFKSILGPLKGTRRARIRRLKRYNKGLRALKLFLNKMSGTRTLASTLQTTNSDLTRQIQALQTQSRDFMARRARLETENTALSRNGYKIITTLTGVLKDFYNENAQNPTSLNQTSTSMTRALSTITREVRDLKFDPATQRISFVPNIHRDLSELGNTDSEYYLGIARGLSEANPRDIRAVVSALGVNLD